MTKIIKTLCASVALLTSGAAAAEANISAQLMVELRFGGTTVESNNWQANALVGQSLSIQHGTLPVYSYSVNSNGVAHSTLMGAPITLRDGQLSVDGGFGLSTAMMMAGFAAAGLVIADQLSDDETPPVDSGDGGDSGDGALGGVGLGDLGLGGSNLPI
jgi:hypothetical protein